MRPSAQKIGWRIGKVTMPPARQSKSERRNKMKSLKWVSVTLMVVALAFGFAACSGKEGESPRAKATQEEQAQPADQAAQPSKTTEESAGAQSPLPGAPPAEQPQDAAQAPGALPPAGEIGKPEVAEIMGTVLDSGGEIIVFTDQGNYAVTGEDLSDMVGKTVRVLGSLQEDQGRRTIKVISVYEIK
jgi:type IV secretory pathway VirB10-like protein